MTYERAPNHNRIIKPNDEPNGAPLQAAAAMDWLEMADLMDARTSQTQDYSFSRYAPLAAAGVHYLCRSDQRAAISQPKKAGLMVGGGV